MKPTREQVAWAAGLFEGEGCLSPSWVHGGKYLQVRIQIRTTDVDVLHRFASIVGAGSVLAGEDREDRGFKQIYVWSTCQWREVERICLLLEPWLGNRRKARVREVIRLRRAYEKRGYGLRNPPGEGKKARKTVKKK